MWKQKYEHITVVYLHCDYYRVAVNVTVIVEQVTLNQEQEVNIKLGKKV